MGTYFLRILWSLAEHAARNSVHLPPDDLPQLDPAVADLEAAQARTDLKSLRTDFKSLRSHFYTQSTYQVLADDL